MPSVNLRFKVTVRSKVNLVHLCKNKKNQHNFIIYVLFGHENITKQLIVHIEWPRSLSQGLI